MEIVLLQLAVILFAAKIAAEICERFGHNAALGELLAGLAIAVFLPGFVEAGADVIETLASLGILFMIFMVGLESRLEDLEAVEKPAVAAAFGGSVLPFILGAGVVLAFGYTMTEALFVGAALTASSIGVTAKVFMELGKIRTRAAEIILGAAVIDDVLSLLLLAVVMGATVMGGAFIGQALLEAGLFWLIFVPLAWVLLPKIMGQARNMKTEGSLLVSALVVVFVAAYVAEVTGFAAIVGAFVAGIILARTKSVAQLTREMHPLYYFLTPIFFVSIGMMVDPHSFAGVLGVGAVLTLAAVAGKVAGCAGGLIAAGDADEALLVGVGMLPRGEVALIIVTLAEDVIDATLYAAVVFMAVVSIFITPILLNILYARRGRAAKTLG